jgi:hypothetical protein
MPRQRCDLCLGKPDAWVWAVEFKLLRLLGDNGKLNDNMLMHILSPYEAHRSALTDCRKLLLSGFQCQRAIVIVGYESGEWPLSLALNAFEALAGAEHPLGHRIEAHFEGLRHPIHSKGIVSAWELLK